MKCNIINDLLNLYVDDLCSKESNELIEKHIKSCSKCHEKYELLLKEKNKDLELEKNANELEEKASKIELKPFAKLRKKLLFRCVLDVVVIIITLVCIVTIGGYLYRILTMEEGTTDFNTYLAGRKAVSITEKILNGDTSILFDNLTSNSTSFFYMENDREFESDVLSALKDEYNKNLKGKKFEIIVNSSSYMSATYSTTTDKYISTFINVINNNGDTMTIWFKFDNLHKYSIENMSYELSSSASDNNKSIFENICYLYQLINDNLASNKLTRKHITEQYISVLDADYKSEKRIIDGYLLSENNKNDKTFKHLAALFDKGIKIDNCSINNYSYDTETKHINAHLILTMSNNKNNVWTIKHPIYYNTLNSDSQNLPYAMFCDDTDSEVFGDIPKDINLNDLKKIFRY